MKYRNLPQLKKLTLLFSLLLAFMAAQGQQKYTVRVKIEGLQSEMKAYLQYRATKELFVKDSAIAKNGTFRFNGISGRPLKATLLLLPMVPAKKIQVDSRTFYLSSGVTAISGNNLRTAAIKGGKAQDDYMEFTEKSNTLVDSVNQYTWKVIATSAAKKPAIQTRLDTSRAQLEKAVRSFIAAHNNSYVSLDLVGDRAFAITDPDGFQKMYDLLSPDLKNTPDGKKYAQLLYLTRRLAIGQQAIEFTQNDPNGKPVSLASLKGKYVLIDFWASWCGPCRVEYPYLKKAYSKFSNKDFEIISVSLDSKSPDWIKAIKDNGFEWTQVCDFKGFNNDVAVAYGVYAIPRSFLIDPTGKIIAKDLRNDNLIEKLNSVIKTQ
ncbi:TlpA disulfide reductase family protein [Mucilaginibacter sp.]|uniref:TlpA disulfide reductase family protein n=1 Tax=Mucilaginibacter sp. TaxID=1882438 RepID=UPI002606633C|nr:TlpA disulfide reductase family protein [Mucilaginibacter sp.]MDB4925992.1 hypothetical protein [Mucilaginibacter sp.]